MHIPAAVLSHHADLKLRTDTQNARFDLMSGAAVLLAAEPPGSIDSLLMSHGGGGICSPGAEEAERNGYLGLVGQPAKPHREFQAK